MACCLEVLGWLAARHARFDRAAWLLGAAEPLWRRAGSRLSSIAVMEQSHQRVGQQARQALGDTAYESAHAQGGALDLDTVVGYALDERGSACAALGEAEGGPAVRKRRTGRPRGRQPAATMGPATPATAAALTRREREIAILVGSGLSNREIASRLFISKRTVDAHVEHIFAKLEISSRVKLTLWLRSEVRMGS